MANLVDEMESFEAAVAVSERINDLVEAIRKRLKTLDPDDPVALVLKQGLNDLRPIQSEFNYITTVAWNEITRQ